MYNQWSFIIHTSNILIKIDNPAFPGIFIRRTGIFFLPTPAKPAPDLKTGIRGVHLGEYPLGLKHFSGANFMILFVSSKHNKKIKHSHQAKKYKIMKKLTNISPFLLLLVPVFIATLLTLAVGNSQANEEMAMKSAPVKSGTLTISTLFSK
ncbi:hypothetical protein [Pedobacter sp. JY14-1]|uniref:hypothetical protein n=1 Tax=Pedobacter sp. JY14-1 TaxID=3034151 RepID=UPI0023E1DBEA|nr:hypothetical protein [Pedobacter sp. JY14-1]